MSDIVEREMVESLRVIHKMEAAAAMIERLVSERDAARSLVAEAREVVRPFAVWRPVFARKNFADAPSSCPASATDLHVNPPSVGHLRAARSFLEKTGDA